MELCYESFVELNQDEMQDVDGGNPGLVIAIIAFYGGVCWSAYNFGHALGETARINGW